MSLLLPHHQKTQSDDNNVQDNNDLKTSRYQKSKKLNYGFLKWEITVKTINNRDQFYTIHVYEIISSNLFHRVNLLSQIHKLNDKKDK
jgi:hypothetical protein